MEAEPSITYGSDVNTDLRRSLDDHIEAAYQSKRRITEGRAVALRYRVGNTIVFPGSITKPKSHV